MAEEGSGVGDRLSGAVQRVKEVAGRDQDREADEAGGRVQAVREALRAFGEGEHDRFLEVFDEEVEWVAPEGSKFPGAGTHSGREAVGEKFVGEIGRGFPAFGFRPDHYLDADEEEWVLTLGVFTGEGGTGGFEVPGAVVWEFSKDKVARVRIYTDTDSFPEPVEEEREEDQESRGEQADDEEEGDGEDEGGEGSADGDGDGGGDDQGNGEDEGEDEGREGSRGG
jgi:ketosteroid isomerase-like protein